MTEHERSHHFWVLANQLMRDPCRQRFGNVFHRSRCKFLLRPAVQRAERIRCIVYTFLLVQELGRVAYLSEAGFSLCLQAPSSRSTQREEYQSLLVSSYREGCFELSALHCGRRR